MKKIISIHLNNKVFQIEEEAYLYLQQVMAGQWQKAELEKQLAVLLSNNSGVLTMGDITAALNRLGIATAPPPPPSAFDTFRAKRLFRQPRGKMLGGVCTGLGEYLEVDPVLLRILFVLSLFLAGAGVIVYLALWLIIPNVPLNTYQR